ncbi:MAG: hypothetical protein HY076_05210 [Candidatus Eisenbacteria bacterium]|uniref:Uncharacterized protein n=1 Tax=Eiseniibacteriota bacterium TaxID=2212470 RepID=A0A9D6L6F6_UNCEI|nr:hypothetical protein [Candidatus Eisenbacteria bacterium]MBI3539651.1 hypothetical protein [Candidatus Eisenbacteria bacterium]
MSPTDLPFWDAVDRIREKDPRYRREAYGFVMAALGTTVQSLPPERLADPERRHLSGAELLAGVIALARREFGLMATTVFREWGVTASADVGAIVFRLVEVGQLSARPEDRPEDFAGGPDLVHALSDGVDLDVPSPRSREGGPAPGTIV